LAGDCGAAAEEKDMNANKQHAEERGSGLTNEANMRELRKILAESYARALDAAGVKGSNKETNLESFKSGTRALLHQLKEMGIVKVVP
jgi:hypothetical protein